MVGMFETTSALFLASLVRCRSDMACWLKIGVDQIVEAADAHVGGDLTSIDCNVPETGPSVCRFSCFPLPWGMYFAAVIPVWLVWCLVCVRSCCDPG